MRKFFGIFDNNGNLKMLVNPDQIVLVEASMRQIKMTDGTVLNLDAPSYNAFRAYLEKEGIV